MILKIIDDKNPAKLDSKLEELFMKYGSKGYTPTGICVCFEKTPKKNFASILQNYLTNGDIKP